MTRNTKSILIRHYGAWIKQHLEGWDGYFFRVIFQQLPASLMITFPTDGKGISKRVSKCSNRRLLTSSGCQTDQDFRLAQDFFK
jgi:hypothetical protein